MCDSKRKNSIVDGAILIYSLVAGIIFLGTFLAISLVGLHESLDQAASWPLIAGISLQSTNAIITKSEKDLKEFLFSIVLVILVGGFFGGVLPLLNESESRLVHPDFLPFFTKIFIYATSWIICFMGIVSSFQLVTSKVASQKKRQANSE